MALTQVKTDGIANGAVTTQQLAPGAAGGPKVTQIQITNAGGTVLDDTAVSLSGGYIKITGTGFAAGAQVIINSTPATSVTFTSTTVLNVQVPAMSAGTYVVYVVNTDGGVAIAVNGLTYSGEPTWVTGSTLPTGVAAIPISIQLSATGDTPITYALSAGNTLPTGLSLTSGGLLSGTVTVGAETTYNFSITATDVQAQDSPRTFTITITTGDPYFYLTTLLLPGNGTNNGTNNTFLDSSTNNLTITRAGNTTQGTFTPFSLTGWSNYFDGNGDSLTFTATSAVSLTGAFTIEFWIYLNSTALDTINPSIITFPTQPNAYQVYINSANTYFALYNGTADVVKTANGSATLNQWIHIAVSRDSSNNLSIFLNGSRSATTASGSGTVGTSTGTYRLMSYDGSTGDVQGYLSNLRIVKGTAVYDPTQTTLTVPTSPLTAIANTSLLTCQNNRFIDNSTNNFTITRNGDVSVQSFEPFAPGAAYSTSTVGGSAYFDGTGDYLTAPDNAAFDFGSGDFTIEGWIYPLAFTSPEINWLSKWNASTVAGTNQWLVYITTAGVPTFIWSTDGTNATGSIVGPAINLKAWTHIAVTRSGSTATLYVNGVGTSTSITGTLYSAETEVLGIGYRRQSGNPVTNMYAYSSGIRFVKGTAVYTGNFSVPTSPPTAVANTSFLLNFTNGQITDATSKNDLETVGDAKISTAQSKWGGSSMYFDGTNDLLRTPPSQTLALGSSDFTIECWVRRSSPGGAGVILQMSSGTDDYSLIFGYTSGSNYVVWISSNGTSWDIASAQVLGTWENDVWVHYALTRQGSTFKTFKNGIQQATWTSSSSIYQATNQVCVGGAQNTHSYFGYINDLRITRYARYTANFTPPASAFLTL